MEPIEALTSMGELTLQQICDTTREQMQLKEDEIQGMYIMGLVFPANQMLDTDEVNQVADLMGQVMRPHIEMWTGMNVPIACMTLTSVPAPPTDIVDRDPGDETDGNDEAEVRPSD